MAREYNIKWNRSDYARLSHKIKKVNEKIFAIEVKRPDIADQQPAMLDYQEVKANIKTRKELNKFLKMYDRYLRDGAEEIIKTERGGTLTKWQEGEIKLFDRVENAKKTRLAKQLGQEEVTQGNKSTGNKRSEMGKIKENSIKHVKHNIKNMSQKDINALFRQMEKKFHSNYDEEKKRDMLKNYIKGLISEGYSDELINMLLHIPLDEFTKIIDTDEYATFDFIYDPLDLQARCDQLIGLWNSHVDENTTHNINIRDLTSEVQYEYDQGLRARGIGRIRR